MVFLSQVSGACNRQYPWFSLQHYASARRKLLHGLNSPGPLLHGTAFAQAYIAFNTCVYVLALLVAKCIHPASTQHKHCLPNCICIWPLTFPKAPPLELQSPISPKGTVQTTGTIQNEPCAPILQDW